MRRVVLAILAALLFSGQVTLPGFPPGVFYGRGALDPASGPTYVGPGNLGLTVAAFWGFRCYSAAYSGNVADIWDAATGSTTETLLTCSPGGTINQTVHLLSVTCAVSCNVKTVYEQSGGGESNITQATNANRPLYTANAINTRGCATFTPTQTLDDDGTWTYTTPATTSLSLSTVAIRTGRFTSSNGLVAGRGSGNGLNFYTSANTVSLNGALTGTATDSKFHTIQGQYNSAGDALLIDGALTTGGTNGTGLSGLSWGHSFGGLTGSMCEGIVFKNSTSSTLDTNQTTYYGPF